MTGMQRTGARLFYEFDPDAHVPPDHILREIDRFPDTGRMREQPRPYCSHTGRPPIDPDLLDDAASGAVSPVHPRSDPAAQWTRVEESRPYFAYANNYLIGTRAL